MSNSQSKDAALIERVRAASKQSVDPAAIEDEVGLKALVNTSTGLPVDALRRVELVADEAHAEETLELDEAAVVVYWERPIEADNPHIVGLQISATGTAKVFFAVILPP